MIDKHSVMVLDPAAGTDFYDRVIVGQKVSLAGPTGAGTQTLAVTFTDGLPQFYSVFVEANIQMQTWVTAKTSTGFTVNCNNGGTIPANTLDILVVAA
jgi:hypothetical protein